jgi:hypothetical protein
VLHVAVRENKQSVLTDAREQDVHGFGLPRFVEDELRAFLRCGVLVETSEGKRGSTIATNAAPRRALHDVNSARADRGERG